MADELPADAYCTGDGLFACDAKMRIIHWNAAVERLTGVPASEALGRPCWDVLRGADERGGVVCHAGCSGARLAREGWPVPCHRMVIRSGEGTKRVLASTISMRREGAEPIILHVLRGIEPLPDGDRRCVVRLTPRQLEVVRLLADGIPAKVIARQLGIAEVTVRNHIHATLRQLRCHSQLAAVAEARRLGVL